jgi:hypothetical protein
MDFFFPPVKKVRQHYFIGALFKDRDQIQELVKSKKLIKNKVKSKYSKNQHGYHSNYQLSTNLIYLGYLEEEIAQAYMDNTFDKLLTAITKNMSPLLCEYTQYSVIDDKSYYQISLQFKDIDNKLNEIILPYLFENGIKPIYHKKDLPKPKIDLLYVNKKGINYFEKRNFFNKPPNTYFTLDYLTLIKGVPVVARSGTPSTHDQMNLEEIEKYKYYFSKKENISKTNLLIQNTFQNNSNKNINENKNSNININSNKDNSNNSLNENKNNKSEKNPIYFL